MWISLTSAHQDSSTGGRVYWIRKLLLTKMENDDILGHIDTMANYYKLLNSLVSADKPLTPDDVHSVALLSSIPQDWLHCVSALMNQDGVRTEAIVSALKNEYTRRQSQPDTIATVSSAKTKSQPQKGPADNKKKSCHCTFCNVNGHDLNMCNNTCRILEEHKASQKAKSN